MADLTLRQFVEAIRKNGLEQNFGAYYGYSEDGHRIVAACALGQAAINLNVRSPNYLNRWYYNFGLSYGDIPDIVEMNDNYHLALDDIAIEIEIWATEHNLLDKPVQFVGEFGRDGL